MKRDNQWRPAERRYKEYAPYQRCRLKAANPVTPEEAVVISKRCNKRRHIPDQKWKNGGDQRNKKK